MITEKQKQKVIELYQQGNSQTSIAKKENLSRTKISEIIKGSKNSSNIKNKEVLQDKELESDPEIRKLQKKAIKEKYRREIRELKEPFQIEEKLKELEESVELLNTNVDTLFEKVSGINSAATNKWVCPNCGIKGKNSLNVKCNNCEYENEWGWQVH